MVCGLYPDGGVYPDGVLVAAARIVYALGYSSGDPAKRLPGGAASSLVQLGMIIALFVTGMRLVLAA